MGCNCKNKRKVITSRVLVNSGYLGSNDYAVIERALSTYASNLTAQQIGGVIEGLQLDRSTMESAGGFRATKSASNAIYTGPILIATKIWQMLTKNGIYSKLYNTK